MTMVPLALYFVRQHLKLKIALVRGKKLHDKRATTRERDDKRELAREAKLHGRH
jgi:SsrA-binding protein